MMGEDSAFDRRSRTRAEVSIRDKEGAAGVRVGRSRVGRVDT